MALRFTLGGVFPWRRPWRDGNESRETASAMSERRSWMERLAMRLELSVFDLWMIILTVSAIGVLYLIGEVAARLSGLH